MTILMNLGKITIASIHTVASIDTRKGGVHPLFSKKKESEGAIFLLPNIYCLRKEPKRSGWVKSRSPLVSR